MGLLSRARMDKGLAAIGNLFDQIVDQPPARMSEDEWGSALDFLEHANRELADIMHSGKAPESGWEWASLVKPSGYDDLVTIQLPDAVGIPANSRLDPGGWNFVAHSHPSLNIHGATGDQTAAGNLSLQDLYSISAKGAPFQGTTAIDPDGGFGYAFRNAGTPDIPDVLWKDLREQVDRVAHAKANQRSFTTLSAAGSESFRPRRTSEPLYVQSRAVGQALKNSGYLAHYGRLAGSEAAARGEQMMEPAVEQVTDVAENIIQTWLRTQGYSDGVIRGIIASLAGSGGLVAAASKIQSGEVNA